MQKSKKESTHLSLYEKDEKMWGNFKVGRRVWGNPVFDPVEENRKD